MAITCQNVFPSVQTDAACNIAKHVAVDIL